MTSRLQLTNKIHEAATEGPQGSCRDSDGRWAATACGTRNARTRPCYVAGDRPVTCEKCLAL
jgi:hypothetical protein